MKPDREDHSAARIRSAGWLPCPTCVPGWPRCTGSHETGPAIALVPARGDLPLRYARLRRSVQSTFGTQIRMTPLPGRLTEALCLVDKLAR